MIYVEKIVGECSPEACKGACCRHLVMPIPDRRMVLPMPQGVIVPLPNNLRPQDRRFYETRGVRFPRPLVALVPFDRPTISPVKFGFFGDVLTANIQSTCPMLDRDGRCKIHGELSRPLECRDYPVSGLQIAMHPECTYKAMVVPKDE